MRPPDNRATGRGETQRGTEGSIAGCVRAAAGNAECERRAGTGRQEKTWAALAEQAIAGIIPPHPP